MILRVLILVLMIGFSAHANAAKPQPLDWSAHAAAELEGAKKRPAVLPPKISRSGKKAVEVVEPQVLPHEAVVAVAPTAATVVAEVPETRSIIERTGLRFTFLFEPYRPNGTATFGSGQELTYSDVPMSALGQVDLRWLPFEIANFNGRALNAGGYVAAGYARSKVPLLAPSGFRYDDVALNTLRYEAGFASGFALAKDWNLEARMGIGQNSVVQTSRYPEVIGSFDRMFINGALDLSYFLTNRFAIVASVARRSPLGDGNGSLAFDPFTVSGGFLVQVR